MFGADTTLHRIPRFHRMVRCLAAVAFVGVVITGCGTDHRISLDQFMKLQQEMREAAATSASAEELASASAELEDKLGAYRVGPGDVLLVRLTSANEVPVIPEVQVRVTREGVIDLPLVGSVAVADLELEDADKAVREAFVPHVVKDAVAHVQLIEPRGTKVLVTGAVSAPGLVPLRHTEQNLLFAIVGAGGASDLASGKVTLRRIRRPSQEVTLDLTHPAELKAALSMEPLEDGDIINVHAAAPNTVYVGGLVNAPSPQSYPAGVQVTILQALAGAGGLRTDIYPKEGTLIRRMPDGTDVHVKLALNRIQNGRDPNILLAAGDIFWVPHTAGTRVQDFINRNIFLRAGVSVNYSVRGVEYMNRHGQQSRSNGSGLEDSFDPLGFLNNSAALQSLVP